MDKCIKILDNLFIRYPMLVECRRDINIAYQSLVKCYEKGGKVLYAAMEEVQLMVIIL